MKVPSLGFRRELNTVPHAKCRQIKRVFSDDLHKEYKKYNDNNIKKGCIFISIASYRDKNCIKTAKSIYDNAL